ncbi:hypothetical protein BGL34_05690 [Fructilactobacillus lindneri]|uniref:Uncharacterized protein n=2 Tax=Fructilactobacillus lindneri TaxID=53444 RepID=A0A0R2JSJ1_9LACO|nr:hypothetical protein [Fructilactobacillus lindneri]ANZ57408.1 hypothetical protein AYR60_00715 [Fructilactobacillus lindneri]ANZ58675.1 hypothetical protein AYR59_00715 [Fructilactobacillus lindneri]KRN80019.1 hypothetical protein IV52_GL000136 [Fructilactobacillus lindneri DSM 20690 = JCM 11027]POG97893.1 hypothetical protein BGL31_05155 [Fructilactobacillus lindneri]POG99225.1 hypothetical protein BGL32_05180 [Fructilactobacillus lindneri]
MTSTTIYQLTWQTFQLFLLLSVSLIGLPLLTGFLTAKLGKFTQGTLVRGFTDKAQYWLGGLGVIIHELGHLFFSLLFFHRIKKLTLLNFSHREDGSLGSVITSHDKGNWYQAVGNFFIGLAPMFSGIFVIWLLLKFLCHPFYSVISVPPLLNQNFSIINYVDFALKTAYGWLTNIFTAFLTCGLVNQIILLILIGLISTTTFSLSNADLKSSLQGAKVYLILVLVLAIIASIILYYRPDLNYFLNHFVLLSIAFWLVLFILISVCLLISWLEMKLIICIFHLF